MTWSGRLTNGQEKRKWGRQGSLSVAGNIISSVLMGRYLESNSPGCCLGLTGDHSTGPLISHTPTKKKKKALPYILNKTHLVSLKALQATAYKVVMASLALLFASYRANKDAARLQLCLALRSTTNPQETLVWLSLRINVAEFQESLNIARSLEAPVPFELWQSSWISAEYILPPNVLHTISSVLPTIISRSLMIPNTT